VASGTECFSGSIHDETTELKPAWPGGTKVL